MKARETALLILNEIEENNAYANLVLKNMLDKTDKVDKQLATEIVYGVVRYKMTLDYVLFSYSKLKDNKISKSVKNIIRCAIYQILYLDKIPVSAACNEAVKLVYKYSNKGAVGFVNAILRNVAKNKGNLSFPDGKKEHLMYKYSYPSDILDILVRDYGEKTEAILLSLNLNKKICVRPNLLKISSSEFEKFLLDNEIEYTQGGNCFYIDNSHKLIKYIDDGTFFVQDRASMMCVEMLAPNKGEKVLDLCAAPGGKTLYMAQIMQNSGSITACDIHQHRVDLIKKNIKKAGINIVDAINNDATILNEKFVDSFDKVLVDAPCSGLGVIAEKPDIKWSRRNYTEIVKLQKNILNNALDYVKPGGVLLYSTCTINKDENVRVVEAVLKGNDNFTVLKDLQLIPDEKTDGFYMCLIKRN